MLGFEKKVTFSQKGEYLMSINKRYLLSVALLSVLSVRADVYGKSYLSIRPRFELNFPERIVMFRDKMDAREDGRGYAFEVVGFFGKTVNPTNIAKYFLPNGKDYITVGEDASDSSVNRTRDVNAFHLGILTDQVLGVPVYAQEANSGYTSLTFESKVSFCPQQRVCGLGLAYQQRFKNRFWWDISAPILSVKNTLGVKELIYNKGGGAGGNVNVPDGYFANALCALGDCNADRKYGRIVSRWMKKTGLSHIELRFGRDVVDQGETALVGAFLGAYIPTGNKPCGYYMFEPVVGNNCHWGIMLGGYGAFELMRDDDDRTLNALYSALTRYFIPNHQRRSFDLRGLPWSRYLKVWKSDNNGTNLAVENLATNIDYLINYSTLCAKVKPQYSYDFNVGFNYTDRGFKAEAGYNLYARKAEEICFDQPMKGEVGRMALAYYIAQAQNNSNQAVPYTYQGTTIDNLLLKANTGGFWDEVVNPSAADSVATYLPITINDLDPNSAAAPASIAQVLYASLGYEWKNIEFPVFINGGASYEFTNDNTSVCRWTAWFKFGFSI